MGGHQAQQGCCCVSSLGEIIRGTAWAPPGRAPLSHCLKHASGTLPHCVTQLGWLPHTTSWAGLTGHRLGAGVHAASAVPRQHLGTGAAPRCTPWLGVHKGAGLHTCTRALTQYPEQFTQYPERMWRAGRWGHGHPAVVVASLCTWQPYKLAGLALYWIVVCRLRLGPGRAGTVWQQVVCMQVT